MIVRFCLYSVFKNLRFFDKFFVIYLLAPSAMGGLGLSFFHIGLLTGYQGLLTGLLEVPTGFAADHWGRRRSLAACFACYVVAFPLFAYSALVHEAMQVVALVAALTAFGVGEALRTGTHKAIMLDWADQTLPAGNATRLIGVTRFWSKTSAGISALAGGILVWQTASFAWLFWAATVPAVLGVVLALSYPTWLEGEYSRSTSAGASERPGLRRRIASLWAVPGIALIFWQSVLFESQFKLCQHYLQPFLQFGVEARDLAVVGGIGALLIGLYYLVQEVAGGVSSWTAVPLERRVGGSGRALAGIHIAVAVIVVLIAVGISGNGLFIGVAGFLVLTVLQNLRRPIFVSRFNRYMDKSQRAATLSIESQGRSFLFAILAPSTGWMADEFGLGAAFAGIAVVLGAVVLLGLRDRGRVSA